MSGFGKYHIAFLYGTLLDPALLASITGAAAELRPARLRGWRRVALLHGRFPTLRRGGGVAGAVATVNAASLRRLDGYEGREYRRLPVRVRGSGRWITAWVWIARGGTGRPWRAGITRALPRSAPSSARRRPADRP